MAETILSTLSCGLLIAYLIFVVSFWFRSVKAYSNLVKYEYENLPEQWMKDGEPNGMVYWRAPKRSKNIFNRFIRGNPAMKLLPWLFYTPKWLDNHPEAQNYLKNMRKNVLWWNLGILLPFILFLILGLMGVYD